MARVAVAAAAALACAALAVPARASAPPSPWDGVNPYVCELQNAGFGTVVPHPDADPYCVEFDKRRQNVSQLGVVDFLSKEPARVAAASDKCFYFQSDHWRGSVVQDDGSTKTYEWDGHYFFDKAKAEGGVWVTNFNLNGGTFDPTTLPGFPADYARFFGPGTGGMITHDQVQGDPSCAAKAAKSSPYAASAPERGPPRCAAPTGDVGADHMGPVPLGVAESKVWKTLGAPYRVKRGFLRYCVPGGGKEMVGLPGDRSGSSGGPTDDPVVFLLTTSSALRSHGIGRGSAAGALLGAFPRARARFTQGTTRVYALARGLLAGVRSGRVRFLAVYDPARVRGDRALRDWLRRSQ
jgi:hypothetical protein